MERPRPLADEVRRRREPRLPGDAAARQEPDGVVAEEPRRAVGRVTCVRVLRQEDDETALDSLVQRSEQQRQRGLRDAGTRRQRLRELGEALVLDELPNECV